MMSRWKYSTLQYAQKRPFLANNLQEMWDCDNHPEIQCQDHEIVDVQVYRSDHRKDQSHLKMQLSSDHYHLL